MVQLADKLLKKLLAAHPSLYWSRACARALLGECALSVLGPGIPCGAPDSFCLKRDPPSPSSPYSPSPPPFSLRPPMTPPPSPHLPGMLEAEEGDRPMGQVPVSMSPAASGAGSGSFSMVWKWLQSWIYTAAAKAPSRTGVSKRRGGWEKRQVHATGK